ncbi:DctP family TRAP transporter solute-binding subunit [Pseudogracilibacillus auburnensis]|uniref:C4-dicarboxylate-binding protein DctP n=1 Tax=Pseudogracilibacillus auburnensis TaxID=1494959 RepID=A0A2V3VKJ5_9BACI|nr:DctP family TRAP transporter solute-binding subunit [Pseudogracilibacillus auburnensis]PXW82336.1 C4-dicarboxylate-binding protein DctP [Pseudogracilibacillus auburnensis]
MKRTKLFSLCLLVIAMLVMLAACGGGKDEGKKESKNDASDDGVQEITIKLSHEVAENTSQHVGSIAFKEYIENASEGKIEVQVYPNGQLYGDQDVMQSLAANNVQFTQQDLSKLVGDDERFNIPSLPFLFASDDEAVEFWDSEKGMEILSALEKDGIYGLAMWPNGPKHFTNNKRPLKSPEDFKGLNLRTQGGQVLEDVFKALDAGSVSIPFTELYTSLQQGVVDGQTNTFVNTESKKFDEVQKYLTVIGDTRVDVGFFANKEFMDSLNDETKKIVEEGIKAGTDAAREASKEMNEKAFEEIKNRGNVEVYELTDEEREAFVKVWEPVYEKYAPVIGEEYIEAAQNVGK